MRLYKRDRNPKYLQIYDWIHAMIRKGRLAVGDRIPTEPDLARQFDSSRMTVRKAIDPLVLEGILERRPGKGTFVISSGVVNLTYDTSKPTRFLPLMQKLGVAHDFEVIEKKVVKAGQNVRRHLKLAAGSKVICLTLVLYAGGKPVIIERNFYPYKEFKKLMELDLSRPPMALMEEVFGVKIKNVRQFISAVAAGEKEMALFTVDYPIPCVYLEWISYDEDDLPLNVCLCHYRGDAFKFKVPSCELVRPDML